MESFACENRIAPGQNLFDFIVQKRLRYGIIPLQADWKEVSHAPLCVPLPRLGFLAVGPALARPTAAFYRRNRAAFAPFDPVQPEDFFTEEGQAERLAEELGWAEAGRSFRFLLVQPRHPGKIIGALGFNEIVRGAFQSCFVSYKIDAALWGRGYGSEAIRYGTGWAFRVLGLHRAEANVMPRNAASLRAAEKAGYRPEGLARRYLNINGVWEDHIHMVKLNEEEYHA